MTRSTDNGSSNTCFNNVNQSGFQGNQGNNQLSSIPKTAFNKAPIEGPVTTATSSVAVLNQTAKGMIAIADVMKTVTLKKVSRN